MKAEQIKILKRVTIEELEKVSPDWASAIAINWLVAKGFIEILPEKPEFDKSKAKIKCFIETKKQAKSTGILR